MRGQWIGIHEENGSQTLCVCDLEEDRDLMSVFLGGFPANGLNVFAWFDAPIGQDVVNLPVRVFYAERLESAIADASWADGAYPEHAPHAAHANLSLVRDNSKLVLTWKIEGREPSPPVRLEFCSPPPRSSMQPASIGWAEFEKVAEQSILNPRRFLYRGQARPFSLRTTIHRRSRSIMTRYNNFAIPKLHAGLSSQTTHFFNIDDAAARGAFYALAQHHGFPTPLLDWTYSPYVAAFFAVRDPLATLPDDENPRIYVFDVEEWLKDHVNLSQTTFMPLHLSVIEPYVVENRRSVPQQSALTLTNVDDLEGFIRARGAHNKKEYLRAYELRADERRDVLRRLYMMGISAGSMFPGLDGTCEHFAKRFFDI